MENSSPHNFALQQKAVVVAPAGCGKTELIADSVRQCGGRQLVLTHTHAGVDSLRRRFSKKGVPSRSYNLETIHSFALRYANAYPALSKIPCKQPKKKDDYPKVIEAANNLLKTSLAKEILQCSYTGVFVDEYQDCTTDQHQLIMKIAEILPCRIVGDHLQGIFDFNGNSIVDWKKEVDPYFQKLDNLDVPHRWAKKNSELGNWLLSIRNDIENKQPINLSQAPINWHKQSPLEETNTLLTVFKEDGDVFVICEPRNPNKPHSLAKNQQNRYRTIEPITSDEICLDAASLENEKGKARLDHILKFVCKCLTKVVTDCRTMRANIDKEKYRPNAGGKPEKLFKLFNDIISESRLEPTLKLFEYLENEYTPTRQRYQLWREMKKGLEGVINGSYDSLECAVWKIRNISRFVGRRMPKYCISRTVLLKGLECDHGIIIDADSFDSKNLYVALTRASLSLTVLSNAPVLIPKDYRARCPKCLQYLVPRYNEKNNSSFLGCSKFPDCKHIQAL